MTDKVYREFRFTKHGLYEEHFGGYTNQFLFSKWLLTPVLGDRLRSIQIDRGGVDRAFVAINPVTTLHPPTVPPMAPQPFCPSAPTAHLDPPPLRPWPRPPRAPAPRPPPSILSQYLGTVRFLTWFSWWQAICSDEPSLLTPLRNR